MKYFMIAPMHDVDSLTAHVIGEIWQPKNIDHRVLEYGGEPEPFRDLSEKGDQNIVMADFGYSGSPTALEMVDKLEKLRIAGTKIDMYDQHNWKDAQSRAFNTYTHSSDISSAEIMSLNLVRNNPLAMYLAKIATREDYGRYDDETGKLTDLVNSHISKDELIRELATLSDPRLILSISAEIELEKYRKYLKPEAESKLKDSVTKHQTPLGNFRIGLAPELLYMKPGHRYLRDHNSNDNTLCFFENHNNILFRTKTGEQAKTILGIFDGDGRGTEGGFDPGEVVTEANYARVRDKILEKIRTLD